MAEAAEIIKSGGVVAFPTETVYGLGAERTGRASRCQNFQLQKQARHQPRYRACGKTRMPKNMWWSMRARGLMQAFWPGPLTMILPKREGGGVSDLVSAGLSTIAMRMPNHPVALKLIETGRARPCAIRQCIR